MGQTIRTILECFLGHYANINKALRHLGKNPQANLNAHPHQLEGDIIGLHFATTHNSTKDVQIQVLEFIRLPANSERGLKLRLVKETFWIHRLRCSAPQGLNIME